MTAAIKLPLPYIDPYFPAPVTAGLLQAYATAAVEADRQARGEPVAKVFTRRCFHEYEGSEKQDPEGYLVHDYFWFKRFAVEGTTYLYTAPPPAHTEAEVQEKNARP